MPTIKHLAFEYLRANSHLVQQEYEEAKIWYGKVLEKDPEHFMSLWNIGYCHDRTEDYSEAIKYYDKVLMIEPNNYELLDLKGNALAEMNKYSEAIEYHERAIQINPRCHKCLFDMAITLRAQMKHLEAKKYYEMAILVNPNYVEALNNQAWLYSIMGKNEDANIAIDRALDIDPDSPLALDTKGFIYQNCGEYNHAIKYFDRAIENDERHVSSWTMKGMVCTRLRRYDDALKCFNNAVNIKVSGDALSGMAEVFFHLYQYDKAKEHFKKAIRHYKSVIKKEVYNVDVLNARGIAALNGMGTAHAGVAELLEGKKKEEKFYEAIKCFDRIIEYYEVHKICEDYDFIYACRNKGVALVKLKKYQEAIDYGFEKALKIDPNFAYALNGKGIALANLAFRLKSKEKQEKQFCEALERFEDALDRINSLKTPRQNKGDVLDSLKEYDKAIKCFEEILKEEPDFKCALVSMGRSLGCQKKYDEARKCFDEAIQYYTKNHADKEPCFANAYRYKGYTLLITAKTTEQLSEAIHCYEQATKIDPDSEYAWNSRGYALTSIGDFEQAVKYFNKALQINQEFIFAWANKGYAYTCLGELDKAENCFDKALEIDSENAYVNNYRGLSYVNLRKYARAVECFEKSLQLDECNDYVLANKGYAFFSTGQLLHALDCFEKIKGIKNVKDLDINDPVIPYALNGKGIVLDELKRHDEAKECFRKAMRLDPIRKDISYFNIARSNYQEEDFTEAMENFRKINDSKLESQKRNGLGLCCFRLGLYDDAEKEYRDAIRANPKAPEQYYNLGVLYNSEDKPDRAKALFNTCLSLDNGFSKARDAIKKLEGANQLSDWYNWWFKSSNGKKVIGLTLISFIIALFFITAFISIAIPHLQLQNIIKLPSLISTTPDNLSNDNTHTATPQKNDISTAKPDIWALIVIIILLLMILLLPSLRSIKLGTIELATSPINADTVEIIPFAPMPFKTEYMALYFHMPLKAIGFG
jgi:tetratricopeptide (TPR) repeat protein